MRSRLSDWLWNNWFVYRIVYRYWYLRHYRYDQPTQSIASFQRDVAVVFGDYKGES